MKRIKNILKAGVLAVALGCSTIFTSCTDFLTIYPTNSVIHENFWQTSEDVNGVLATSYLQLLSSEALERMIVWGELRADIMGVRSTAGNTYKYIVEGNLQDNNSYCNWAVFYRAINYANMVIEFAPMVTERDPDFTQGDLDIVLGEMYAVRALSHFYLVRAFRDIPLSYKASLNDAELGTYPQVHPCVTLDSIMNDLDRAEGLVMRTGGFPNGQFNYSRITRDAVLAMKADVNLWRAAFATYYEGNDSVHTATPDEYYLMAIDNCDKVINSYIDRLAKYHKDHNTNDEVGPGTNNPYYLATNGMRMGTLNISLVYDNIFGSGKDFVSSEALIDRGEVLFELKYDEKVNNSSAISSFYGSARGLGLFNVANSYIAPEGNVVEDKAKYRASDLRLYNFTDADKLGANEDKTSSGAPREVGIGKYACKMSPAAIGALDSRAAANYRSGDNFDANWIIYRLTDVMLMKAEALAHLSNATPEDCHEAFTLAKHVNLRWLTTQSDSLQYANFDTKDKVAQLVLNERARELAFEGKRWFDLVRVALRDKKTDNILFVADKVEGASTAVRKKLNSINTLFFPIAESELNVNEYLVQNPAYENSTSVEQN